MRTRSGSVAGALAAATLIACDASGGAGAALHQDCTHRSCELGACVSWCGIDGCAQGTFHTCEIACPSGACPAGMACTTVADGPGAVCVDPAMGWP